MVKKFELINIKGEVICSIKAISSFHAMVKYLNNIFDCGRRITEESKPVLVNSKTSSEVVNIESMVEGLYNFR